jgi:signal transduction histidine kinase
MTDAETGQRGYIITGSRIYLDPYLDSLGKIDGHVRQLRTLTADNPPQQERITRLEPRITDRMRLLRRGIELRETGGMDAARQHLLQGRGKHEMDEIRALLAAMAQEEQRLLAERSRQSRASGRSALFTLTFANLLLVGLTLLAFFLIRRDFRLRQQAEAALLEAHANLEIKVQARTEELAAANAQLSGFARDLERSNRELQDFAFVASHDLQEPLRKIQAFGDRLRSKHGAALGDEGRDYLERMQAAARRMHNLINDLLTFSRVTSKAQPFVPTDLGQVVREVLADLEFRVQETEGEVEVGDLCTIDADPLQMRQLFQNLIGNALKFHRPGVPPLVRITAGEAPGEEGAPCCRIEVEDNGIGFDVKYLDRIFTPFQRLHGRTEYEGTGMGLAVCRRIVERHGGTITAESTPGEGTRFLAMLPMRQNATIEGAA